MGYFLWPIYWRRTNSSLVYGWMYMVRECRPKTDESCFTVSPKDSLERQWGSSPALQWLRLHAFKAGSSGSIPGQGIKTPHVMHLGQNKINKRVFSPIWLFVTPWTLACQTPLSMGLSRQEYWSGLPCPSPGPSRPWDWTHISYISCIGRWVLYH